MTSAEVIVIDRVPLAPRSRTTKVWVSPLAPGNRPAFSVSTSLPFTRSTPSTDRTSAPRERSAPAAVAGELGWVYATTTLRGGAFDSRIHSAP
jgi:hypothetical protein